MFCLSVWVTLKRFLREDDCCVSVTISQGTLQCLSCVILLFILRQETCTDCAVPMWPHLTCFLIAGSGGEESWRRLIHLSSGRGFCIHLDCCSLGQHSVSSVTPFWVWSKQCFSLERCLLFGVCHFHMPSPWEKEVWHLIATRKRPSWGDSISFWLDNVCTYVTTWGHSSRNGRRCIQVHVPMQCWEKFTSSVLKKALWRRWNSLPCCVYEVPLGCLETVCRSTKIDTDPST